MNTGPGVDHYQSQFLDLADALPGHGIPWLREIREDALGRFLELGFPTPRHEDWKYTRTDAISKAAFHPRRSTPDDVGAADIAPHEIGDTHLLVFVDGHYLPGLSNAAPLPQGVEVRSLAEALRDGPDALEARLAHPEMPPAHAFSALNTAFMGDGACIRVGAGVTVPNPIHLLFVASPSSQGICAHPRILVMMEPGSRAAVIESYAGAGDAASFSNVLTDVSLGANARLDHYKLQQESTNAYHVATLQVRQDRDSRFYSHSVSLGARLARNDINIALNAEGAECELNGLYMGNGRQHVDFHTRVDHFRAHGTSRELYKGILGGRARGVFNGRVYVHPDAQKTDAQQANANLLLSPHAEVDTKPQLEIYADDVKCAHGATVGQLDETMLFYLRSRGLDLDVARNLLTYGFAREIVDRMDSPAVRNQLRDQLIRRLPDSEQLKDLVI
jgi:Fe-S cluster assembly protein SufD